MKYFTKRKRGNPSKLVTKIMQSLLYFKKRRALFTSHYLNNILTTKFSKRVQCRNTNTMAKASIMTLDESTIITKKFHAQYEMVKGHCDQSFLTQLTLMKWFGRERIKMENFFLFVIYLSRAQVGHDYSFTFDQFWPCPL